jgi:hypothetical protein
MSDKNMQCVAAPRADLLRQAGAFLIEHAAHRLSLDVPEGQTSGVFASCADCSHGIHYPLSQEPEIAEIVTGDE